MVTVAVPAVAVALAVNVSTLLTVVGLGLKVAVTPSGSPDAASATLPANPPAGITVMLAVPDAPWMMVKPPGFAESVTLGGMLTVRVSGVEAGRIPAEAPVTVTVAVPTVAVALAVSVSTLLPVVGLGLKVAVTPPGSPDAASATLPANPLAGVTVMLAVPVAPWKMVSPPGFAESVKLGGMLTVSGSVRVAVSVPDVPVMAGE
jgi:hypothetical protein